MEHVESMVVREVFAADDIERIRALKELKERLIGSYDYIDWLYDFTKTRVCFMDDDWIYDQASESDSENIDNLSVFFDIIKEYFEHNLLPITGDKSKFWCTIKYKDAYFNIGAEVDEDWYTYVERYEVKPINYVEFEKILSYESDSALKIKQERLLTLEHLLLEMYNLNIPRSEVIKKVQMVFK